MKLTWHIVRKDLRRLAWPVAAWVAFVVVAAIWFGGSHMPTEAVPAHDLYRWIGGLSMFAGWAVGMQIVTGFLLAGHLVLEDTVVGTTAFWLTRPLTRGRLLAAKITAGGLLLVVAPTLALVPVWLANGFSLRELMLAAGEFVVWQAVTLLVAFAFASLTANLGQFFFAAVGVAVAFVVAIVPASYAPWFANLGSQVEKTRQLLVLLTPIPILALVIAHQFLTRRTRRGWLAIAGGLLVIHAIRVAWPLDLTANFQRKTWPAATRSEDRDVTVAVERIVTPFDRDLPHATFLRVGGTAPAGEFLAPQSGRGQLHWARGRWVQVAMSHGGLWGEDAAERLAGLRPDKGPVVWDMATRIDNVVDLPAAVGGPAFAGEFTFTRMRGRVLAEVPLRAGAVARSGSSQLRIVGLGEGVNFERPCIVVEERDALFVSDVGPFTSRRQTREADDTRQDCYLLVNRALGVVKCLHIVEVNAANTDSLLASVRQLEFSLPDHVVNGKREELAGWREGAVLIKVRFELVRRLTRAVSTEHVALVAEAEQK